jgi:hypothetical protein
MKDITECPHCRQTMVKVSTSFKAPRRNNVREWERLYQVYRPYIAASPQDHKVRLTHDSEYEREISGRGGYEKLLFSRKLTPRRKIAK